MKIARRTDLVRVLVALGELEEADRVADACRSIDDFADGDRWRLVKATVLLARGKPNEAFTLVDQEKAARRADAIRLRTLPDELREVARVLAWCRRKLAGDLASQKADQLDAEAPRR
jgi:hypothetical protein